MKQTTALIVLILTILLSSHAQPPQAMKYKAIAKDEWGLPLPRKDVSLRFTIYQGSKNGTIVYMETHQTTTTQAGLMDVNIGEGTPQMGSFSDIDWGAASYYIKVELDPKGGTNFTLQDDPQQLLSVPYALYAGNLQDNDDADADPQNELISNVYLSGTILYIVEGNLTTFVDLSGLQDGTEDADSDPLNELQNLSVDGHELSLSNGNTVTLPDEVNDADNNPANEIQVVSLENNILTLSTDGDPIQIDLTIYLDNTDAQSLSIDDHLLSIHNGNTIQLPDSVNDADHDPANELQVLNIRHDSIFLSDGGFIKLPATGNVLGSFVFGDGDRDGFGDPYKALWLPVVASAPEGYLANNSDCDDTDPGVNPDASEVAGDGIDQDCNSVIDDIELSSCREILVNFFNCAGLNGCDFNDLLCAQENCADENPGFLNCLNLSCLLNTFDDPSFVPWDETWTSEEKADYLLSACGNEDEDGDGYSPAENDCDDSDPAIHPGATEICGDGIDQDCDGSDLECCFYIYPNNVTMFPGETKTIVVNTPIPSGSMGVEILISISASDAGSVPSDITITSKSDILPNSKIGNFDITSSSWMNSGWYIITIELLFPNGNTCLKKLSVTIVPTP